MNPFQDIQSLFLFSLTPGQVIRNIAVAFVCGLLISRFYCWTNGRPVYVRTYVGSLVTLAMITAVVIMVIENNLARAFGLVGAMSIIRFRTAVKDVQDIAFIFFSLAIGMAAGVGMAMIAFIGTVFVGAVMVGLSKVQTHAQRRREYLLQFAFTPSETDEAPYLPILGRYCRRHHLVNMKSYGNDGPLDLAFYVHLRDQDESGQFVQALGQVDGVQNVNLFFDEELEA